MGEWSRSEQGAAGRYWFHLHTNWTHGVSSPAEYMAAATLVGMERLVFLEHIRSSPTYDPRAFDQLVRSEAEHFGVKVEVGFEAKILRGGELDIQAEVLAAADIIGIAEHRYEGDVSSLVEDFRSLISNLTATYPDQTFVWVHPGSWFQRNAGLGTIEYRDMLEIALAAPMLIERNLKYHLLTEEELAWVPATKVITGLDAHSAADAKAKWMADVV